MISVLYVDDEETLLDVARIYLERTGDFSVAVSTSAKKALELPAFSSFDAVISDYQMPGMDGIGFLKAVRERFGDIPFILFTGRGREEIVIQAINNGADFYLQKGGEPASQFAELAHKLRQAVRRKQAERSLLDSERRLADITSFLPDPTFAIDRSGHVITWNRAIEEMTGIPASEMLGKGDNEYAVPFYGARRPMLIDQVFEPDDVITKNYQHVIREKDTLIAETSLPRPMGRVTTLMGKASPLYTRDGEIAGAIESIRDISERKRLEADLEQKHRELLASYEQITAAEEELREQYDELAQNEQRIRVNEERLTMAQEISHTGSWEYNIASGEIWGSAEGLRIFGFNRKAGYIPINDIEACIPERERVHQALVNLLADGEEYNLEYTINPADGSAPRVIHSIARRDTDAAGNPTRVTGVIQDITERRQRDEELAFNNAVLSTQQETTLDAILIVDESGKILNYNQQFIRIWGLPEDLVAAGADEPVLHTVTEKLVDPEAFLSRVKYLYEHKEERSFEELPMRDGRVLERFSAPMLGKSGKYYGRVWYFRDITERKRAESALLESEEKFRTLVETANEGIWAVDSGFVTTFSNRKMQEILGYSEEEMRGRPVWDFAVPEERPEIRRNLLGRQSGKQGRYEQQWLRKDGTIVWCLTSATPFFSPDGTFRGSFGVFTDITERKQMEESLRQANLVVENSPVVIFRWEAKEGWPVAFVSRNVTRFGYTPEEFVSGAVPYASIVHPEDLGRVTQKVQKYSSDGPDQFPDDYRIIKKGGEVCWVDDRTTIERDASGKVTHYQGILIDITERKQIEEVVRGSEERLQLFIRHAPAALAMFDRDMRYLAASRRWMTDYNLGDRNIVGQSHYEIFPELSEEIRAVHRRGLTGEVLSANEEKFERRDGSVQWLSWEVRPWYMTGGSIGGIIIYSEDITERRKAESALSESEQRFRNLIQNSSDMIRIIGSNGLIAYSSPSTLRIFGYGPEEVIGKDPLEFIHPDDRALVKDSLDEVVGKKNSGVPTEYRIRHKDGHYIDVEAIATNLLDNPGIRGIVTTTRPITERKKCEASLRESESRFATIFKSSPVALTLVSATEGVFVDVNDAFCRNTGYSRDEVIGKSAADLAIFSSRAGQERLASALRSRQSVQGLELECRAKSGAIATCRFASGIIMIEGRPHILSSVENITDYKAAEDALRRSEERLHRLTDNMPDMIYRMFLPDGRYEYVSPASALITGFAPDEFYADPGLIRRLIHPAWREYFQKLWQDLMEGRAAPVNEYQIIDRAGKVRWLNQRNVLVPDDQGKIVAIEGIVTDISRQKTTERELHRSELRSLAVSENAGFWIWEVDAEGIYCYSNPAVVKILGYRPEEIVGKMHFYDLFDPSVRDELMAVALSAFASHEPFRDFSNLNRHKNGTPVLLNTSGAPVFDENGAFTGYCGIDEDITERTAAQSALQAMVTSMVGTTGLDSLWKITKNVSTWLTADCVMIGEIQPDHETVKVLAMLLDGKEVQNFIYTLRGTPCENVAVKGYCLYPDDVARLFPESKDLAELSIRSYLGTPLRDSRNNVIGILCVLNRSPIRPSPRVREIMDIIAVKAAAEIERIGIERELRESQDMLARAMDLTNLVNWEYDREKGLYLFNDRFYALYGTSAEREGGYRMTPERYIRDFVHPDDLDAVTKVFNAVPADADPGYDFRMEHRIIRRDGEVRYILVRAGVVAGKGGQDSRVHGANQDITERRRAEEALRQAHKKLHLLSGITRHDINNQLLVLNAFAELLHREVPDSSARGYISRIRDASNRISAMIAFTREYEKIGVNAPVWQDLEHVVRDSEKGVLPDQIILRCDLPAGTEVFADPLLVRVFFNLLDNSIRHGMKVTEIRVTARISGENLVVVWEDDGIGIPAEEKEQIFERGFGKNTGLGMFLAREILSLTGITIRETGVPGTGARFEITVPVGAWRNREGDT